jgi:hypothetical protein
LCKDKERKGGKIMKKSGAKVRGSGLDFHAVGIHPMVSRTLPDTLALSLAKVQSGVGLKLQTPYRRS